MSGQNTLITCALDNQVVRPKGAIVSRQFYRDKSPQGSGVYKAMDENGNIEIIGGPGSGLGFDVESGLISRLAGDGSGTDTLTTLKQIKLLFLFLQDSTGNFSSFGMAGDSKNADINSGATNVQPSSLNRVFGIKDVLDGFTGSAIINLGSGFDLNWTQLGAGKNVSGYFIAITS